MPGSGRSGRLRQTIYHLSLEKWFIYSWKMVHLSLENGSFISGKIVHLSLEKWFIYLWKMVHLSLEKWFGVIREKWFSGCKVGVGLGKNGFPAANRGSAAAEHGFALGKNGFPAANHGL